MVTKTEIRIGNWLRTIPIDGLAPHIIDKIQVDHISPNADLSEFSGIPITPQLCQSFGALIIDESEGVIGPTESDPSTKKIMQLNLPGGYRFDIDFEKKECVINYAVRVRNFEYLHQFQNIVFDITGKELVINQPLAI